MYLCRELTELSLPKIGQQFGGRDHTTVMHAERKIRSLMAERRSIYNQVNELTNRIKQTSPRVLAVMHSLWITLWIRENVANGAVRTPRIARKNSAQRLGITLGTS